MRPRGWVTLGAATALVIAVLVLQHRGHPGSGTGPPGTTGTKGTAGTPAKGTQRAAWLAVQPFGTGTPAIVAVAADPDGSLWLVATAPGAGPRLLHATAAGEDGAWPIQPAPATGAALRIQTVGTAHVWLAAGSAELSFNKAAQTFRTRAALQAVGATTVGGYSVGLYETGGAAAGPPYVLVAPTGGLTAQRVSLPGSAAPPASAAAALLPGPSGTALAVVGSSVWAVSPDVPRASAWGRLPAGADPGAAAWGGGRLWFEVSAGAGAVPAIDSLTPGGTPTALGAARSDPAAPGGALVFDGTRLWWTGGSAAYAYDPGTGRVTPEPYPVAGRSLLVGGPTGSAWVAVRNRFALLR